MYLLFIYRIPAIACTSRFLLPHVSFTRKANLFSWKTLCILLIYTNEKHKKLVLPASWLSWFPCPTGAWMPLRLSVEPRPPYPWPFEPCWATKIMNNSVVVLGGIFNFSFLCTFLLLISVGFVGFVFFFFFNIYWYFVMIYNIMGPSCELIKSKLCVISISILWIYFHITHHKLNEKLFFDTSYKLLTTT